MIDGTLVRPARRKLPSRRKGYNQKLKVGGQTVHLRTGEYADGRLGEIFLDCHKTGTLTRALLSALAISVSVGLQHGVPLEIFVQAFKGYWFPPLGTVEGHPIISEAASILDAVFRDLELTYLRQPEKLSDESAPRS